MTATPSAEAATVRVVFVTCPPNSGAELLRRLVDERLVACGNILPGVRSIYRWKGDVCDEPEEVLLMETSEARVAELMKRLPELHPYEVPKILTLRPEEALAAYAAWVQSEVTGSR